MWQQRFMINYETAYRMRSGNMMQYHHFRGTLNLPRANTYTPSPMVGQPRPCKTAARLLNPNEA
ncbi:hypothetical protein MHA01_26480 [Marinococcus halophilus]|uniref:Uncharacterized protein n=1 Tax=Marinococcus halophilus TaxID=1371 RepID=A0A510Y9A3_MARHA|nr:hypothetical protein MHA01_26480 [Marinococcus halophilus]